MGKLSESSFRSPDSQPESESPDQRLKPRTINEAIETLGVAQEEVLESDPETAIERINEVIDFLEGIDANQARELRADGGVATVNPEPPTETPELTDGPNEEIAPSIDRTGEVLARVGYGPDSDYRGKVVHRVRVVEVPTGHPGPDRQILEIHTLDGWAYRYQRFRIGEPFVFHDRMAPGDEEPRTKKWNIPQAVKDLVLEASRHGLARFRNLEIRADGGPAPGADDIDPYAPHYEDRPQEPEPDPARSCVRCGREALHACDCCAVPLCGKHNEVGAGFCHNFTTVEIDAGAIPVCETDHSTHIGTHLLEQSPNRPDPDDFDNKAVYEALADQDPDEDEDPHLLTDGGRPLPDQFDFVLTVGDMGRSLYHFPDPEDPERPRCEPVEARRADQYRVLQIDTLPDAYRCCRFCDPTYTVPKANEGETLASKLEDSDSLDDLDSELVTDGGQPPRERGKDLLEDPDVDAFLVAATSYAEEIENRQPVAASMHIDGSAEDPGAVGVRLIAWLIHFLADQTNLSEAELGQHAVDYAIELSEDGAVWWNHDEGNNLTPDGGAAGRGSAPGRQGPSLQDSPPSYIRTLEALSRTEWLDRSQIADRTPHNTSTVSEALQDLDAWGYAERSIDPQDGRRTLWRRTDLERPNEPRRPGVRSYPTKDVREEPDVEDVDTQDALDQDNGNGGMDRLTVRLPEQQLERVEALIDAGVYPNRTEVLRSGLRRVLNEHRGVATDGGEDRDVCQECGEELSPIRQNTDWVVCRDCSVLETDGGVVDQKQIDRGESTDEDRDPTSLAGRLDGAESQLRPALQEVDRVEDFQDFTYLNTALARISRIRNRRGIDPADWVYTDCIAASGPIGTEDDSNGGGPGE